VQDYYARAYPAKEVVVSYAGRLIKEKGILNLLEAFAKVRGDHPKLPLKLVIAGDGELLQGIREQYGQPGSGVDILGKLDFAHVMALFKRSDIFVYPSLYPEGLPTSILEAGLLKCAVIATPRGGTEEVITTGQHGIISDGSVDDLYHAIDGLVIDPGKRQKFGAALQAKVKRVFNWDAVAHNVDQEINSFNTGQK
jgi:glycosyltransferase involved in cell wall biosynthesis